jgi:hypothetical protein
MAPQAIGKEAAAQRVGTRAVAPLKQQSEPDVRRPAGSRAVAAI